MKRMVLLYDQENKLYEILKSCRISLDHLQDGSMIDTDDIRAEADGEFDEVADADLKEGIKKAVNIITAETTGMFGSDILVYLYFV